MADRIPSVQRYKKAFASIGDSLHANYRAMLRTHFIAPDHTITMKQLAKRVGYSNFNAAVLQYGKLGERLCLELDFTPPDMKAGGSHAPAYWTYVLADAPSERSSDEWQWKMRPQVVQALNDLGWFTDARTKQPLEEVEDEDERDFPEGRVVYRQHRQRERNTALVKEAKARARRAGKLRCVICDFDFFREYGDVGEGFIECHHAVPLSSYAKNHKTRVEDLALICSNCHRMLHRKRPWLTIVQLSKLRSNRPRLA